MHENFISRSTLASSVLWALTVVTLSTAWALAILDPARWLLAGMLAATSCVSSCAAAIVLGRVYALRTCALIRAACGQGARAEVQPIR